MRRCQSEPGCILVQEDLQSRAITRQRPMQCLGCDPLNHLNLLLTERRVLDAHRMPVRRLGKPTKECARLVDVFGVLKDHPPPTGIKPPQLSPILPDSLSRDE